MNHLIEQPKLWQKFHECEVTVICVDWKDDKINSMLVEYPKERFGGVRHWYHNNEEANYSLFVDGEPVFTAVKL